MKNQQKSKGILFIILAALCFAGMTVFVRLSGDLPSIQKSFFRNLVAAFFAAVILIKKRQQIQVGKGNWKYLILRSVFGTMGILFNFYAVDHLVLSDANMLNKLSPFLAILFSWILLKEKPNKVQIFAVIAAFAGSLLIIKPSFVNAEFIPAMIGFFGGASVGMAYTIVRMLGKKGITGSFVVFFFSAFSCLVTLPYLIFGYQPMTLIQTACLLGAGLCAAGGQFSITAAYYHAPAKELSVYDYSQIVFSALLGFFIFGQVPDKLSVAGYICIIGMAVFMFHFQRKQEERCHAQNKV